MRNYVIIGGSSGIGSELVNLLDDGQSSIFATYNTNSIANSEHVNYQQYNVLTDTLNLEELPEEIHGFAYCPGAINLKPFHRFTEEDFIADYRLQVLGATKLIQQLLPRFKKSEEAAIVLFSTIAVQSGFNFHSQVAMSKGAIEGLTRSLAAEFAPKIRVNAVAPSLTATRLAERFINTPEKLQMQADKNPLKKVGQAKDIAEAAAYLISQKSSWITGQIMHVDGGSSIIKQ